MLVGHVAVGLIGKRVQPKISLGTIVLAALVPDLVWCMLMLVGVERITISQGRGAANYLQAVNIGFSHSLLTNVAFAAIFMWIVWTSSRSIRAAWAVGLAVLSHWALDVVAHRPDMPLAPGSSFRLGMGLWTSLAATLVVEGGLWCLAVVLYIRATRAQTWTTSVVFWLVAGFLTLAWYNNIAGPAPANVQSIPISSFLFFSLVVLWAYWIDRSQSTGRKGA